ncbi:aromatic amino acid exporter YddG [Salinarimonas soli]|uniref:DMT family transporter n=1 Tax=Salinarimonas soli TaxID=1638099 RepID=A0A5B2VFS1_9HYPH|nr:DMT family transporter [Salinarimonas soli]KAA2237320.1 DMT family transporter [Salinarimonas soli]
MKTRTATSIGLVAIALWALLALFTAASGTMPAFQLTAVTFLIGGLSGAVSWLWRPGAARALRQPVRVWALGVGGLFGYHALYFAALRLAPPAEAGLVNYLWPLLIVVFSGFLPGERLRPVHVAGAVLGFAGVAALSLGSGLAARPEHVPGYACAFVAAFVWAAYSVLSRRVSTVPTDAVAGFCLATSALSALCHLAFETTVWPVGATQWLALLALGLGPVGLAFYAWDAGMKRGDIRMLGVVSYAIPVLSTLSLVAAGYAEPTGALALSCALIVAGALTASSDKLTGGAKAAAKA